MDLHEDASCRLTRGIEFQKPQSRSLPDFRRQCRRQKLREGLFLQPAQPLPLGKEPGFESSVVYDDTLQELTSAETIRCLQQIRRSLSYHLFESLYVDI